MHCLHPIPFEPPSSSTPPLPSSSQVSLEVTLECKSDNLLAVLFTLLAFKSIYLWVGLFLAFENRRVNIPALDDSKYIAASVYCSFVTCIPLVPIGALDVVHKDIRYGIIAGGLLFANTIILALLFIPRVGHACMHRHTMIIAKICKNTSTSSNFGTAFLISGTFVGAMTFWAWVLVFKICAAIHTQNVWM